MNYHMIHITFLDLPACLLKEVINYMSIVVSIVVFL